MAKWTTTCFGPYWPSSGCLKRTGLWSYYTHCTHTRGVEISTYGFFLFTKVKLYVEVCWHTAPQEKKCHKLDTTSKQNASLTDFFFLWRCGPKCAMASSFLRFLDHTHRRITVGRTPLDEWSVRRRDLYLTTHNTHNRQTSMPPVGFEPTISAVERP